MISVVWTFGKTFRSRPRQTWTVSKFTGLEIFHLELKEKVGKGFSGKET